MKHLLAILAATTALTLAGGAMAADALDAKTKHTTDISVDKDGATTKTMKSESVNDADGLMNKKSDSAEVKVKTDSDGDVTRTSEMEHKDADGTNVSTEAKTKVEVDAHGNVITTNTTEKKTDPKGLFNSKTDEVTTKTVNGQVVKSEHDRD